MASVTQYLQSKRRCVLGSLALILVVSLVQTAVRQSLRLREAQLKSMLTSANNGRGHDGDGPTNTKGNPDPSAIRSFVVKMCQPRHIHLSVGGHQNSTHSSMIVSFSIRALCAQYYGERAVGAVRLGEDIENMTHLVIGDYGGVHRYNASLTELQLMRAKNGQTHYLSDDYHHIEIKYLKPGTRYFYECLFLRVNRLPPDILRKNETQQHRISNNQIFSKSNESTFLTPPAPGQWYPPPLDRSIKFAVLGDLATRSQSRETVRHLEHNFLAMEEGKTQKQRFHRRHGSGVDCILLAGDISYANCNHFKWDTWMDMMGNHSFFQTIPMQVALGNHDLDWNIESEMGLAYEKRFRMPQVQPAIRGLAAEGTFEEKDGCFKPLDFLPYEFGNAFYSFTFGPSKHIVLSSYSSFRPGSVQYEWLLSELRSVDRTQIPWLVIMLHCPIYTTFKIHREEIFIKDAKLYLEPIFVEYRVNFVISGHIHSYMRTVPTINDEPNPRGPVYIIQGNGGRQANEKYFNPEQAEEWVRVRDHAMYGYGTLELLNVTHARWKWVKTGFDSKEQWGTRGGFEPDFNLSDEELVTNQLFADEQ